jgi:hypothetical protein
MSLYSYQHNKNNQLVGIAFFHKKILISVQNRGVEWLHLNKMTFTPPRQKAEGSTQGRFTTKTQYHTSP